jgi:hypothetical protein
MQQDTLDGQSARARDLLRGKRSVKKEKETSSTNTFSSATDGE